MIRYIIRIILEIIWVDWQYVGAFDAGTFQMSHPDHYSDQHVGVTVHCFESRWGTRHARIVVRRHGIESLANCLHYSAVRKSTVWQKEIYPWLRGRHANKIPTYKKLKGGKWDFRRMLRGAEISPLNKEENT